MNTYVGQNAESVLKSPAVNIDRVILYTGENTDDKALIYYAPPVSEAQWNAMTGKIVTVTVPWGGQSTANSILSRLSAIPFVPYKATCAELDLAAELGDYVTINGTYGLIAKEVIHINDLGTTDVSAEDEGIAQDKYPYVSGGGGGASGSLLLRIFSLINQTISNIAHSFDLIADLTRRVEELERRNGG